MSSKLEDNVITCRNAFEQAVTQCYDEMKSVSEYIAERRTDYYTNPLQLLMASVAITRIYFPTVILAKPGQGKTFSILHVAHHALTALKGTYDGVVIYCHANIVVMQTKELAKMFPSQFKMNITNEWTPALWRTKYRKALFIIDEGEHLVRHGLLDLSPNGFNGLVALKGEDFLLFSATFSDFHKKAVKEVFDVGDA